MSRNYTASQRSAFVAVTTLFFAWGFITSLIDPLVAAVKGIFTLTNVQAQLSASAFFIAYGLMSFPAAWVITRIRPVRAILLALAMMAVACLVMLGAANLANYTLVLAGLFILASGITMLQVAANPLAAALGSPEGSHFRLTLSQTFNSFGTFIGPIIGAGLFLEGVEAQTGSTISHAVRAQALAGIDRAYFWVCGLLVVLLTFFWLSRKSVSAAVPEAAPEAVPGQGILSTIAEATSSRWALLGGAAIFVYVGVEVSIGTQMAFYLNSQTVWAHSNAPFGVPLLGWVMGSDGVPGVSLQEAARAVSLYWGGAMVGRAVGAGLLSRISASKLLVAFASVATAICCYIVLIGGLTSGFAALSIGLFNSIMFPVIFTLTLERSDASNEATSALLCTCITGGAFVPLLMGLTVDVVGYGLAFAVPAAGYFLLAAFGLLAGHVRPTGAPAPSMMAH
ncbi:MAG: MFS transporter [Sphingobium sp.]